MKELNNIASVVENELKACPADKYHFTVTETETREFTAENGVFSLYRTLYDYALSITTFIEDRHGSVSSNDLSDESIKKSVSEAVAASQAAQPDPAWDIAPFAGKETFIHGPVEPDTEKFFSRLQEVLDSVAAEYPKVQLMNLIGKHIKADIIYKNSNGTEFKEKAGYYYVVLEFAGNDGVNTTGLDYCGVLLNDLDSPFIECGSVRTHLDNAVAQLSKTEIPQKFIGTVIFTPDCLAEFLSDIIGNYLSDGVLLDGTSKWTGKLGEKVAHDDFSLSIRPLDPQIACGQRFTSSGFKAEDLSLIENGILQSYRLSLYAANTTGNAPAKNTDSAVFVAPGTSSFADMVKNCSRGLIVGGFSGGEPGANGEFSGVAKNSYYVENGTIVGAVSETMINGTLDGIINNIVAISSETVCDGTCVLPYLASDGIVVSVKE